MRRRATAYLVVGHGELGEGRHPSDLSGYNGKLIVANVELLAPKQAADRPWELLEAVVAQL